MAWLSVSVLSSTERLAIPPDQGVRSYAMGDDTEQHGPAGCQHDRVVPGQFFVEDENRENDLG